MLIYLSPVSCIFIRILMPSILWCDIISAGLGSIDIICIASFFFSFIFHMSETVSLVQGKYKVYNLCSERLYDASLFEGKVHIVLKYLLELNGST